MRKFPMGDISGLRRHVELRENGRGHKFVGYLTRGLYRLD